MFFRQFVDDGLGCASYVVGDAGEAVVVDPAYEIEPYLAEAERHGSRICCVLETHTHADHVSGHGRLALEHDAPVRIHPAAEPEYPFDALADGEEVRLGSVVVRVVHTPGHRPEHCCFEVIDRSRSEEPWVVLTGDSLFVGEAGRPDLAVEPREGARELYRSLRRLLELPDGVEVFPGHVAGSLCGARLSSKPSTTLGFERKFNPALAERSEDDFVNESVSVNTPKPPNSERIVALNRGALLGRPPDLIRLDEAGDGVTLDVRSALTYAAGHARGAISIPIDGGGFPTKAAFVLSSNERIVLHASSHDEAQRAARGLRSVGLLELGGYMLDPPAEERMEPVDLDEFDRLMDEGAVDVLDVREPDERDGGFIPGSRNVPYRLVPRLADELRGDKPIVTICESGSRAIVAASALAREGIEARPVLGAGVSDWQERGSETVSFRRCGS